MGRRPNRWDPREHDPVEIDQRNQELVHLRRAEEWLLGVMGRCEQAGLGGSKEVRVSYRLRKAVPETKRRGPGPILHLRRRIEHQCQRLVSILPAPAEPSPDEAWLSAGALILPVGTVIRQRDRMVEERARLKARVIARVLLGEQTLKEAAEEWREEFSNASSGKASARLASVPLRLCRAYVALNATTVGRWVAKVRSARAEALRTGRPLPADWEVLLHRQPERWRISRTKRTPEVQARVVNALRIDPSQSSLDLAEQIGSIAPSTVRKLIAEDLSPALLTLLKGGDEAPTQILYSRLPRRPPHFGHTYLSDDTVVKIENVDHSYVESLEDFDLDFHCVQRVPEPGGLWITRRVPRLYMQSIVDGYSRMRLVNRLFPHPPTGFDTLVSLAMAAIRYGLPEVFYTDNGANFTSGIVHDRLMEAGVRQVRSLPAQPEGRAVVEVWFRVIKRAFFDKLPGAGHTDWPLEALLELATLQRLLNRYVDAVANNQYHSGIGMSPRECMERGLTGIATTDPKRILRLLPVTVAVKEARGIHHANGLYWCADLVRVPKGVPVRVYSDPLDFDVVFLSWVPNGRAEVFLGEALRIDEDNPAPEIGATREAEAAVLQELLGEVLPLIQSQRTERRRLAAQVRAEKQAESDAAAAVAVLQEARQRKRPALPPPASAPRDDDAAPSYRRIL